MDKMFLLEVLRDCAEDCTHAELLKKYPKKKLEKSLNKLLNYEHLAETSELIEGKPYYRITALGKTALIRNKILEI